VDEVLRRFVAEVERDASVIGVVLIGSHAIGTPDEESDYDLVVVRRDGEKSHSKQGGLDVLQTTLEGIRNPPDWVRPALAHSRVLLDRTGEVTAAVAGHADVPNDEVVELLDSYLNSLYRSLKAWRRGNELAGRLEAIDSLRWLAQFLFALDGKRAPYSNAYAGRLGEFEDEILAVARTADPKAQQALQARVEGLARARGLAHVYDGWTGEIERVMAFRFD
jgi:predicted nucleotidyltransferase